jgi:hypothetical protein
VTIRLPKHLADQARAAWQREEDDESTEGETTEERTDRHRAGTLALIGLAIAEGGNDEGDDVVVDLSAWFVGLALEAADEEGLLHDALSSPI